MGRNEAKPPTVPHGSDDPLTIQISFTGELVQEKGSPSSVSSSVALPTESEAQNVTLPYIPEATRLLVNKVVGRRSLKGIVHSVCNRENLQLEKHGPGKKALMQHKGGKGLESRMSKSNSLMGKRRRGGEDEVFYDNYHTHKRYLTEVMASSMIGLSVGESGVNRPPSGDIIVSPAHTETGCTGVSRSASSFPSHGDETSTLDSPMSEDSDESVGYRLSRGSEAPHYTVPTTSSDLGPINTTSPCSPRRFQRLPCHTFGHFQSGSLAWTNSRVPTAPNTSPYTPSAWPRCPESDGRLPPSPNDACQSADLRRATLLRNLQMRAQLPAQPDSSATTPDSKKSLDNADEQESVEEGGDQSCPNSLSYNFYNDYAVDQMGCMGSPSPCVFPNQVVRGSPRVRSLLLGESTVTNRPKSGQISTEASISSEAADEEMSKPDQQPSRIDEERSFKKSRSPRSPRSPKAGASTSGGYEVSSSLSPKDGNLSDTESSFTRRSVNRTSLSRNPSVCSRADSSFSAMEVKRPVHAPR